MKFTMTSPCADCPFRSDRAFPLAPGRVDEILDSIMDMDQSFPCHKTVDYGAQDEDNPDAIHVPTEGECHCGGALIFLEKHGRANQMMRICERLGMYDHTKLEMDAPVYDSREEMVEGTSEKNFSG